MSCEEEVQRAFRIWVSSGLACHGLGQGLPYAAPGADSVDLHGRDCSHRHHEHAQQGDQDGIAVEAEYSTTTQQARTATQRDEAPEPVAAGADPARRVDMSHGRSPRSLCN
jgi:sRNA-binding protein